MSLDIAFEGTHQEFATLSQLVDFPVTLLFSDLNHTLLTEFLQVGVYVTTAQSEGVGEVVAVGGLVAESLQDTEFGLRDKTHFFEIADPQRIRRDYGTTESQQKQISMVPDKNSNDGNRHKHNEHQ